jgi:hypothetical protein
VLDFIIEAQNQSKPGACPTKIAVNYRFLDAEDAQRFPADIIAEWVDLPALSISTWIELSARSDITVRAVDCRQIQAFPQSYLHQDPIYEGPAHHDRGSVFH